MMSGTSDASCPINSSSTWSTNCPRSSREGMWAPYGPWFPPRMDSPSIHFILLEKSKQATTKKSVMKTFAPLRVVFKSPLSITRWQWYCKLKRCIRLWIIDTKRKAIWKRMIKLKIGKYLPLQPDCAQYKLYTCSISKSFNAIEC